ncbi:MAG: hypothetical protein MZV63_47155 [Marinilabiliales bacterium]|nr:hypothetical protein [Marinilabiliales bacterium]
MDQCSVRRHHCQRQRNLHCPGSDPYCNIPDHGDLRDHPEGSVTHILPGTTDNPDSHCQPQGSGQRSGRPGRCAGAATAAVNFATNRTGGATTYSWTNNNTSIGLAASGNGNIASFTATQCRHFTRNCNNHRNTFI